MKVCIDNEFLKLPKERRTQDIKEFVFETLKKYESFLEGVDEKKLTTFNSKGIIYTKEKLIKWVSILSYGINEAFCIYSNADPSPAFKAFKKSLDEVNLIGKIELQLSTSGRYFYRMRNNVCENEIDKNTLKIPIKSMLHIPIQHKNIAGYERFSIKNTPALYLSNSLFGCYHELGLDEKKIIDCYVSKVEFEKTNITLFDLRIRNEIIENFSLSEDNLQKKYAYLLMYPLIFACSIIKTENKTKPEYIIPQLFIKWLEEQNSITNFFGIAYSSTKINHSIVNKPSLFYNVVIPTRTPTDKHDYCDVICENLRFTEPIRFLDYFVKKEPEISGFIDVTIPGKEHFNSIIYNKILYEASNFGNVENKISLLFMNKPV